MLDGFKWHLLISSQSCRSKGMADFFFRVSYPQNQGVGFRGLSGGSGEESTFKIFQASGRNQFPSVRKTDTFPCGYQPGLGQEKGPLGF